MTATAWPRERAWQLMTEWTASPALRAHMHAVELCMQHLAPRYDGDPAFLKA